MEEPKKSKTMNWTAMKSFIRRRRILLVVVCIVAAGAYAIWATTSGMRSGTKVSKAAAPAIPVVVAEAKKTDFHVYISGLGSVTPLNTIVVRTRVDGELVEVLFREGQIVSGGELLARIDPRPFEAQLLQAEGQMARDRAQLQNAELDLDRYKVLWEQDSVSKQQLDTQEALVRQFQGAVKADQGQIDSARLQLAYCRIIAPISGRIGLRLVDPGNIVHATDATGLAVITQLQPMSVVFPIPEDSLPQVLSRLKAGAHLPVEAYDRALAQRLAEGSLLTVDNQIDPSTGTVRLKALFPNEKNELFPNQFVNARLRVETRRDAIVVPAPAIQRGPQGSYVYMVKADQTATVRPVTVGEIQEGAACIRTGLAPGDLVVVDGAEKLREGARVELKAQSSGSNSATQKGY